MRLDLGWQPPTLLVKERDAMVMAGFARIAKMTSSHRVDNVRSESIGSSELGIQRAKQSALATAAIVFFQPGLQHYPVRACRCFVAISGL